MAAKQLVAELSWIDLPRLDVFVRLEDPECGTFQAAASYHDITQWRFLSAQTEVDLDSIRPDVVGLGVRGERYAVEIRVAHKVNPEKAKHVCDSQLPCVEIDLRSLVGRLISFKELADYLQSDLASKTWVHHPRKAEYEAVLLAGFAHWRTKRASELLRHAQVAEDRRRAAEEVQRRRDEVQRRNHEFRQRPLTEKWALLLAELGVTEKTWPKHLAVELRAGADAFKVSKEMWQGALFSRFVYGRGGGERVGQALPQAEVLEAWLTQRYGTREGSTMQAQSAIRMYLSHLARCGFLEKGHGEYVVMHGGLLPPSTLSVDARPLGHPSISPATQKPFLIGWRADWPDEQRLRAWAQEYAVSNMEPGFRADDFVSALLRCVGEPGYGATLRLLEAASGSAIHLRGLLKSMGVTTDSWRYLSGGAPPPWKLSG